MRPAKQPQILLVGISAAGPWDDMIDFQPSGFAATAGRSEERASSSVSPPDRAPDARGNPPRRSCRLSMWCLTLRFSRGIEAFDERARRLIEQVLKPSFGVLVPEESAQTLHGVDETRPGGEAEFRPVFNGGRALGGESMRCRGFVGGRVRGEQGGLRLCGGRRRSEGTYAVRDRLGNVE